LVFLREIFRRPMGFTHLEFTNGIHTLQMIPEFHENLKSVDFRGIGDSYYSESLERYLFIGGVWEDHQQIGFDEFYFSPKRYEQEIQTLEEEFGTDALIKLRLMADRFITSIQKYQSLPAKNS